MTGQLYLVGHPIGHSKSPAMHNAAYQALGLDWRYELCDCATEDEACAVLADPAWIACNITMPYKPLAYRMAQKCSIDAQLAQGANVLVRSGDELLADNTDGRGCVSFLKRCGFDFADARIVVCGTGPTALAIVHACVQERVESVMLVGRDGKHACAVMGDYEARLNDVVEQALGNAESFAFLSAEEAACLKDAQLVELDSSDYAHADQVFLAADLIVDATPLGMKPNDPAPFDTDLLSPGQTVLDVVYGHGESALLSAARARGCAAFNGEGMLVAQAVETVMDIADVYALDCSGVDLFAIMADAAEFACAC